MFQKCTLAAALAVFLTALSGRPALAQAKPAPGGFGSVNVQRVFDEYKVRQASAEQVNTMGQSLDRVLERFVSASAMFLPENEARELAGLYEKATPTDAEKTRITALETRARSLSDELRTLQQVNPPNDQQKARLAELTAMGRKGNEVLDSLRQDYQGRLGKLQQDLSRKITEAMRDAVVKVAQARGLAVVFDSTVAIYTTNDLTDEVIKMLNK